MNALVKKVIRLVPFSSPNGRSSMVSGVVAETVHTCTVSNNPRVFDNYSISEGCGPQDVKTVRNRSLSIGKDTFKYGTVLSLHKKGGSQSTTKTFIVNGIHFTPDNTCYILLVRKRDNGDMELCLENPMSLQYYFLLFKQDGTKNVNYTLVRYSGEGTNITQKDIVAVDLQVISEENIEK